MWLIKVYQTFLEARVVVVIDNVALVVIFVVVDVIIGALIVIAGHIV